MASVEEFAQRLHKQLVLTGDLQTATAIAQALQPENPDQQYPAMMYRNGSRSDTRTVFSAEEESSAAVEGFKRTPGPQYEPGFPQAWIERPPDLGGAKTWDHRRCTLYNAAERELFEAAVDLDTWVEDDGLHGGRGVSLDTLVEERRAMLRAIVSQEPLVASDTPTTEATAPIEGAREGEQS